MLISETLEELGIEHRSAGQHHHVSTGWVGIDCPKCSPGGKRWKLGIPANGKPIGTCWTCGRINLVEALAEISGESHAKIRGLLGEIGDHANVSSTRTRRLQLPRGLGNLEEIHLEYLRQRSFSPKQLVARYSLRGFGLHPRFPWRLFIPIQFQGRTVSWTTRSLSDSGRRYVSARADEETVSHKTLLYGQDMAKHAAIIVEGPTDVWRIGPGAVATFGLNYTQAQVAKIAKFPLRAIAFDNEPAAQRQAVKLCEELSSFPGKTVRVEIGAADPGSMTPREVKALRKAFLE